MIWKQALTGILIAALTGCTAGEAPMQRALDLRTSLMNAGGCSCTAAIRAEYEDRAYSFTVACTYTDDGANITVLQPREIAGISAAVSADGARVIFEDVELDLGQMAEGNVSAMSAGWLLPHCWESAYIDCAGTDGDLYRITYLEGYNEEELTVDTWLDETQTPVYAEVSYDGIRCLTIQYSDFQFLP